jgi:hypothetical protein
MGSIYIPVLASRLAPCVETFASALAPQAEAFNPTPCRFSQHLCGSQFLARHSDEPSQQQPVVESAVNTAIATPIELTFIDYLTFFQLRLAGNRSRVDGANITPFPGRNPYRRL